MALGAPLTALAADAEVEAQTTAQAYSLRSPFGDPILYRRRITQTLGLGVYKILGDDERPGEAQVFVKLRLRLDVDFGVEQSERTYDRTDPASRFVPGLSQAPLDLMFGYVEGKNLFGGWFGFRAGRQYMIDSLGWWSFDGGLARITAPYVHVEAYGGYEQRSGLPLSSGRFSPNGVWRGDRSVGGDQLPGNVFPMFQPASLAPAYGFAIESAGPHWIHGRLDYRKVLNHDSGVTTQYPGTDGRFGTYSQTRTSSERLGYALDATVLDVIGAKGGIVYDFYNAFVSSYYGSLDGFVGERVTVSAEYDFFKPTFDGDSIFNWFTHGAITTGTGRVAWNATDRLDLAATGGLRWWATDDDPNAPTKAANPDSATGRVLVDPQANNPTTSKDVLSSLNGRYRWETARATLRGVLETGDRGRREGIDIGGQKRFDTQWSAEARGSIFDWKDELRPDRSATSVGYVLGGGFRPGEAANFMLQWEHNMNHLVGQRYRILAMLDLRVGK